MQKSSAPSSPEQEESRLQDEGPKLVNTSTGRREWKARFQVTPFTDTVDESTIKALERICPEKRVVLHFSTGKDSVAAWLTLRDHGFEVVPVYKEVIPGLSFIDSVIAGYEKFFNTEVIKVPYKGLFQELHNAYGGCMEPLEMKETKAYLAKEYKMAKDFNHFVLTYTGCPLSVIGVKASDSLNRKTNFQMSGPYNPEQKMYSINWRLKKNAPLQIIIDAKCPLPKYYLWLGRSPELLFDSEYAFIKKYYPDDWKTILDYLPDAEVRVKNFEMDDKPRILPQLKVMKEMFKQGYEFI